MKKYEIDMCNGPLFGKIVSFTVPLILSNILQMFFNAADVMIVGRFAGAEALAAVGATPSLMRHKKTSFLPYNIRNFECGT